MFFFKPCNTPSKSPLVAASSVSARPLTKLTIPSKPAPTADNALPIALIAILIPPSIISSIRSIAGF
jgi:hypothetical protein